MDKKEKEDLVEPSTWLKRRAVRAFIDNMAPVGIVLIALLAFLAMGYMELGGK